MAARRRAPIFLLSLSSCFPVHAVRFSYLTVHPKRLVFLCLIGFLRRLQPCADGGRPGDRDTLRRTHASPRVSRAGRLGHRPETARLAAGGAGQLLQHPSQGLPRRRDPRRRQDHLRAAGGLHAHRCRGGEPRDRRGAHRPPEAPVGRRRRPGGHRDRPQLQERRRPARPRLHRRRRHLRAGGQQAHAAPGARPRPPARW